MRSIAREASAAPAAKFKSASLQQLSVTAGVYRRNLPNTEALLPLCPSLGNNTPIPGKDRWELRITFEHAAHSAMPPDTSIL